MIAITTGCREGEIAALEWKYINFDKRTITIEQSLTEVVEKGLVLKTTKNGRDRIVSIPDSLVETLKTHKAKRNGETLAIKDKQNEEWKTITFCLQISLENPFVLIRLVSGGPDLLIKLKSRKFVFTTCDIPLPPSL